MPRSSRMHHRLFHARALAVMAAVLALIAVLLTPSTPASAAGSSVTPGSDTAQVGETLVVDYATDTPDDTNRVAIYRVNDGTPDADPEARVWEYAPGTGGSVTLVLSPDRFAPGEYLIHFLARNGHDALATPVPFAVEAAEDEAAQPSITLSASELGAGETLSVDYSAPAAGALNWIGIYRASDGYPDGSPGSLLWDYAPESSGRLDFTLEGGAFAPGDYLVYFLADDGYVSLTDAQPFTVSAGQADLSAILPEYTAADGRVAESYAVTVDGLFAWTGEDEPALGLAAAPAWLSLDDGRLVGTPSEAGNAQATVTAELGGLTAEITLTLPIVAGDTPLGDDLTILTYNAWHEGSQVADGRIKEIRAFLEQGADVVALQESSSEHAAALAAALGWESYSDGGDCTIISRYPIAESVVSSAAGGARVVVDEGHNRSMWVLSAHLDYTRYGPYYAQEGRSVDYIVSEENVQRGPQVRANIEAIAELEAEYPGVPVIYAGDLNTPSHLDWTGASAHMHNGLVVPWPVSTALEEAGFTDTYRAVHPDPVADPATSWTPRIADEPQDRIDFIYSKGEALDIVDSRYFHGASMSDWASDHGAFATDFTWADASAPTPSELTLSASSILPGEEVGIDYVVADPKSLNWVGIYAADATPGIDDAHAFQYVADAAGSLRWGGTTSGEWRGPGVASPGEYEVYIFEDDGYTVLAGPEALTIEAVPVPEPLPQTGDAADLRVLTWNIYQGGRSNGDDDLVNQQQAAEYIASLEPDVFAAIETYGASDTILAALNDNDDGDVYTGTRITQRSNDNLWIFSRLPIVEVIPASAGLSVDDFNLGAVRVRLENNREVTVYDVWSNYTDPWIGDLIEENAQDVQAGEPARHTEAEIIAADRIQTESIADFLSFAAEHSPHADDVAIIGGDLNTISSEDWGAEWASCPSHYGLSYDLVATRQFADAGYTDTYRADNPDACAAPGVTWSPRLTMDTPDRIDLSYLHGSGATVADAVILDDRLPEHGDGEFYSDHAALLVDYRVASVGSGPGQGPDSEGTIASDGLATTGGAASVTALLVGVATLIAGALLVSLRRRRARG